MIKRKLIMIYTFIATLFITSCIEEPVQSSKAGKYVHSIEKNIRLNVHKDGTYDLLKNDKILNSGSWQHSENAISFFYWRLNEEATGITNEDGSPIFNCRFNRNGICYKIALDADNYQYFEKIE